MKSKLNLLALLFILFTSCSDDDQKMAYGPDDFRGIPGGSALIFEIELIEVIEDGN